MVVEPIGIIHTPYKSKQDTSIQGAFKPDSRGQVEVYQKYEKGLKDIETFSHIILF